MYTQELKLENYQKAAVVDVDTGEVTIVNKRKNNIPEGKHLHLPDEEFKKTYVKGWEFLKKVLTPLEYRVAHEMSLMAKAYTNSLEPLGEHTTVNHLSETFSVDRRKMSKLIDKLFQFGVFAKFEAVKPDLPYTKYWVFNPYLSFSGKLIKSDIALLFVGTIIEKQCR